MEKPQLAIEAHELVKNFGEVRAVDNLSLTVPVGIVYGVLGLNGAGKTTTVRMLATLIRPDSGTAKVFGHDIVSEASTVRSRVSLTGQFASVDEDITGTENLVMLARLLGFSGSQARARAVELLEAFELIDAAKRPVRTYSGGMRRRLDIASSIIVTPDLLFLDEPTTGLDPHSRNRVWDIVRALVAEGTTIILTTQHLEEADQLSDRIAVIDYGRIIAEGTSGELKNSIGSGALHIRLHDPAHRPKVQQILSQNINVPINLGSDPTELSISITEPERANSLISELTRAEIPIASFSFGQASLDEVFLTLTGQPAATEEKGGDS